MGFEFEARLKEPLTSEKAELVLEVLSQTPGWVVVHRDPSGMAFRLASHPPRERWPEDFHISLAADHVYVVFHLDVLIDEVDARFRAAGLVLPFEAID